VPLPISYVCISSSCYLRGKLKRLKSHRGTSPTVRFFSHYSCIRCQQHFVLVVSRTSCPSPRIRYEPFQHHPSNHTITTPHPSGIPTKPGGGNHTKQFTHSARTEEAHEATMLVAKALALTGVKVVMDDRLFEEVSVSVITISMRSP
jgi:hypothetical protein